MASKSEQRALQQALANLSISRTPVAAAPVDPTADADMSFAKLPIDQIEPYHYNPRTGRNPRYAELLESIKADGITNMLTVTRRDSRSKYTTYGGGNTRLLIAKELYAAGDKRFADLQVLVKAWPGDAQVISAQLSENENRADITFWEKANGVERFRVEFEKESGKRLSANTLHAELKKRGINYGIKTLQNFAFALENLQPLGEWLRAAEVNETIRPAYAALQRLAQKFAKETVALDALQSVQKAIADKMRGSAASQQIDVQALLGEWNTAIAAVLDVSSEHLVAMLAAIKDNPGASLQELKDLAQTQEDVLDADSEQESAPDEVDEPAGTSSDLASETPRKEGQKAKQSDEEEPLPPVGLDANEVKKLRAEVQDILKLISDVVPLNDVIRASKEMPFGFVMDMPAHMELIGKTVVKRPDLREAVWKFLVAVSGQLDKRVALELPEEKAKEPGRFSYEFSQDKEAFRAVFEHHGIPLEHGMPTMRMTEIATLFAHPQLPHLLIRLLSTIERLRMTNKSGAPDGFQPLFTR